jgi:hypothetical protein
LFQFYVPTFFSFFQFCLLLLISLVLIDITFTYDRDIVKILKDLEKIAQIDKKYNEGKHVFFALEEKNLITIYKALKPLNFEFSEDFLELV